MWMIVIVAVASGEVVYVDSAADYDFLKSEKECETALTEQYKDTKGTEIVRGELADQLFLKAPLGIGYGLRACVQSPPVE